MLRVAKILLFCSLTSASVFHAAEPTTARGLDAALREKLEAAGGELPGAPAPRITTPDPARRQQALEALGNGGLLLVPESTNDRVMAFDPADGTLIDPDFIPADPDNLSTPINAVLNDEGTHVLVVDQLEDLIFQYTLTGSFDGIFAPAGGPNTAVYDNPRGFENNPFSVNYLATSGETDSIADFSSDGSYLGDCVDPLLDGMDSPFDANLWEANSVMLVGAISSDTIHRFSGCNTPATAFASVDTFPEQIWIDEAASGPGVPAVYVANFSGAQEGILVYDDTGALLDTLNPAGFGGYRGVYPLGNGNLLFTTGAGVHEMTPSGVFVETEIADVSARFIELASLGDPEIFADGFESGDTSAWSATVP